MYVFQTHDQNRSKHTKNMKNLKKRLSLIFAAIILSTSFAACSSDLPEETETPAESVQETVKNIVFASESVSKYKIVRPNDPSKQILDASTLIFKNIRSKYSSDIEFTTDFVKRGTDPDTVCETEILIGKTNRTDSAEVIKTLGKDEFTIQVRN